MGSNDRISNQVIIHQILKDLKNRGYEGFTARPWNYFKPESTLWWLVPSTEWPSYKYGKLVLYRAKEGYRIDAIDKRMEQLTEERNTLIGLMTKGFLEPALFSKERNALDSEIKNLTTEKTNLVMSFTSGTSQADEVKAILKHVSKDKFDGNYTDEAFEKYVENIIVNSRDELTFKLKCGLSLKERVVR